MEESIGLCPCQSSKGYVECCEPYHKSLKHAPTAEQLMRSRYSAYVLGEINYLVQTTLPIQQAQLDIEAMRQWSQLTHWAGLKIIKHRPNLASNQAKVIFEAYYQTADGIQIHHEESVFIKINKRWYFKNP